MSYITTPIQCLINGTESEPTYSYRQQTNTGMLLNTAGNLGFTVNGTLSASMTPSLSSFANQVRATGDQAYMRTVSTNAASGDSTGGLIVETSNTRAGGVLWRMTGASNKGVYMGMLYNGGGTTSSWGLQANLTSLANPGRPGLNNSDIFRVSLSTGSTLFRDGSQAAPSIGFSDGTTSGWYRDTTSGNVCSVQTGKRILESNANITLLTNRFITNTASYAATAAEPAAVRFLDSTLYTSANTYTSGAVTIERETVAYNQPPLVVSARSPNTAIANTAVVLWNKFLDGTSGGTASNVITSVSLEFIANNSFWNGYNGEARIACDSGSNAGNVFEQDGQLWMGMMRTDSTGYDKILKIRSTSTAYGKGSIESTGSSFELIPDRNYGSNSKLSVFDNFGNVDVLFRANAASRAATLNVYGESAETLIRSRTSSGQASVLVQSDAGNANAYIGLRSNWITAGTGNAVMDWLTNSNNTGYRVACGQTGKFTTSYITAGTHFPTIDVDGGQDGLVSIYRNSNNQLGRLRLGDSTGIRGGGILEYNSGNGIMNLTGSNAKIQVNGLVLARRVAAAPVSLTDPGEPGDWFATNDSIYMYGSTQWVKTAVRTAVETTSSTTITLGDSNAAIIECSSLLTTNVLLPNAAVVSGLQYLIIKTGATGTVTVVPDGVQTIDGTVSSVVLSTQFSRVQLVSNGNTIWYTV